MKGGSVSFEATDVQSAGRNANGISAVFGPHLLMTGLWVFAGYYLGCKIGFALTLKPHPVSVLWPPNSVLVASLLLTPPRSWWFVLLAAFPAHLAAQLQSDVPPLMIMCWFISNASEAVIGAGLMYYVIGGPMRFQSLRKCGHFLPLRSVYRPVFVLVFRRRVRGVESLGARRILGVDPSAAIFQCRLSVNHRAVYPNVGDEWSSASENSITVTLLGGMHPLSRFVGSELCCPL
jgi:hypothetical protein